MSFLLPGTPHLGHHITFRWHVSLGPLGLDHLAEILFVRFLHVELPAPSTTPSKRIPERTWAHK